MSYQALARTTNAAWPSFIWQTIGFIPSFYSQPAAHAKDDLLDEAQLLSGSIKAGGDRPIPWAV